VIGVAPELHVAEGHDVLVEARRPAVDEVLRAGAWVESPGDRVLRLDQHLEAPLVRGASTARRRGAAQAAGEQGGGQGREGRRQRSHWVVPFCVGGDHCCGRRLTPPRATTPNGGGPRRSWHAR